MSDSDLSRRPHRRIVGHRLREGRAAARLGHASFARAHYVELTDDAPEATLDATRRLDDVRQPHTHTRARRRRGAAARRPS